MAGEKIIVIEDNPVNMELTSDLLELHGFQVIQAGDAETGIKLARATIPDLIVMDIQLPGMDGLEAARILKEDIVTMNVPIVAITACAMKGDKEKALKAGCVGYITKPVNTREFPKEIKNFLRQNKP